VVAPMSHSKFAIGRAVFLLDRLLYVDTAEIHRIHHEREEGMRSEDWECVGRSSVGGCRGSGRAEAPAALRWPEIYMFIG